MSCAPSTSIPHPPTTLSSCAVPIGGSNSSILHACCNGHINALATYSAPDTTSTSSSSSSSSTPPVIVNSEDNDGCFLYCITDSPSLVQTCLKQKMDEENVTGEGDGFACFEADKVVRREKGRVVVKRESGYANAGVRVSMGWGMRILLGVGVVGIVMGGL